MVNDYFHGGVLNSFIVWDLGFCYITQQSSFLMIEVSLSLNACIFVVCLLTVQRLLLGPYILVLPTLNEGFFQHWSGNVSVFFTIKLKNFVVILIFIR